MAMKWRNLQVSELEGSWGLGNYLRRLPIFCLLSLFIFIFIPPYILHVIPLFILFLHCYPYITFAFTHCYDPLYLTFTVFIQPSFGLFSLLIFCFSNVIPLYLLCIFTFWFYSLLCPPLSNWTDKWKSMDTKSAAHIGASVDQLTHRWKILMRPHLRARLAFCSPSAAITCDIHHYHHYSPFSPFSPLSPLFTIITIIYHYHHNHHNHDQLWFIIISIIVMITFESAQLSK